MERMFRVVITDEFLGRAKPEEVEIVAQNTVRELEKEYPDEHLTPLEYFTERDATAKAWEITFLTESGKKDV